MIETAVRPASSETVFGLEHRVVLDSRTMILTVESPEPSISFGQIVRWRFLVREHNGKLSSLPAGWCPIIVFDDDDDDTTADLGPFESLLQRSATDRRGPFVEIVGEWAWSSQTSSQTHKYFAGIHRGMGLEHTGASSIVVTGINELVVQPSDREQTLPPIEPAPPHRVDLQVFEDPQDPHRLEIEPQETAKAFTNSVLSWTFDHSFGEMYPQILFYASEALTGVPASPSRNASSYFEPFTRSRISADRVEMWGFKKEPRRCFYEAVGFHKKRLALQMLSTGDPQIDNQGIPFPP